MPRADETSRSRIDDVGSEAPGVRLIRRRQGARKRRHERRAHRAFSEQVTQDVWNTERDAEGIHRVGRTEKIRENLVADQSENPAGHRRSADDPSRSEQAHPASLRRTSSFTAFPSTVCPPRAAITAFMTLPMSFADDAPVEAMAASTARSSSAASTGGGR